MSTKEQFCKCLSTFFENDECCLSCDKSLSSFLNLIAKQNDTICPLCRDQIQGALRQKVIHLEEVRFHVIYCNVYNEVLGDYFYRYKGVGDIRYATVFLFPYLKQIKRLIRKRYQNAVLIRMPSWEEDDKKRGFNHVEEIFSSLNMPTYCPFIKLTQEKQSKKTKSQRKQTQELIALNPQFDTNQLKHKQLILIDDVMTTGNTLYRAATLLNLKSVDVVVVAIHEYLSKKGDEKRL